MTNQYRTTYEIMIACELLLKTYQTRLLNIIHQALTHNDFEILTVGEYGGFDISWEGETVFFPINLTSKPALELYDDLTNIEMVEQLIVECNIAREREIDVSKKRSIALAKLTQEERELLGL